MLQLLKSGPRPVVVVVVVVFNSLAVRQLCNCDRALEHETYCKKIPRRAEEEALFAWS